MRSRAEAMPQELINRGYIEFVKGRDKYEREENPRGMLDPDHLVARRVHDEKGALQLCRMLFDIMPADILDEIRKTYVGIKSVNSASITQLEQTESHLQVSLQKVVMDRDHSFVIRVLAKQYVHAAEGLKAGLRLSKRSMS